MPLPADVLGAPVRRGSVRHLDAGEDLGEWVRATDDEVRYEQAGLRILVRGTDEVVVDWDEGADETVLEALLYGFAARTLLLHRGSFAIHGSLVELGGQGLALGGHSGAGKSTTAVELARHHGARVVIDDVLPLTVVDGEVVAHPFERPLHLTEHAFERAGFGDGDAVRIGSGEITKLAVAVAPPAGPVRVDELAVLTRDETPGALPVTLTELRGAERLRRLVWLSNVSGLASLGRRSSAFFEWSTSVAAALPVVEVVRAEGDDTLEAVGDLLADRADARR